MKILTCEWGAYMQEDLNECLQSMGHKLIKDSYRFHNIDEDSYFLKNYGAVIERENVDVVITMNYFPIIAELCHQKHVPYISWVYDCPFDVKNPEKTIGLPTNYVFFFDREQCDSFAKKGYTTVHHMPLAVNYKRLDCIGHEPEDLTYGEEISFVGNMYEGDFGDLYANLSEYEQGYINSIIAVQSQLYGAYVIREAIEGMNIADLYHRLSKYEMFHDINEDIFKKWLNHTLACEVTRRERLSLLSVLSKRHKTKLYSYRKEEMLPQVEFRGTANTLSELPKIYRNTKVNLNISLKEITSGIPLRVFEILGSEGFLLTNWQPEIAENFVDGEELVMYQSMEDAVMKAEYYLTHEDERKQIARNGRKAVERFSFDNQLEKIFNIVKLMG